MNSYPAGSCRSIPPVLVTSYARRALGDAQSRALARAPAGAPGHADWSVEAHLPACAQCRRVLAAETDAPRLDRNRSVLLTRLALGGPAANPAGRREPARVWRLVAATPSLRRSWLAGLILVLATAIGAARLAYQADALVSLDWPSAGVLAFLVLAPMLPLAGVAAAFLPRLDPAADLVTAAPISGIRLYCIRAVAVVSTALGPTIAAAFAMPGSGWLPLLVVLPALAVSAAAVALATLLRPLTAAIGAGAGWVAVVIVADLAAGTPRVAYAAPAQVGWLAVFAAAGVLLAARRRVLNFGWNR